MNKATTIERVSSLSFLALCALALAPAVSRADDATTKNYVTTAFVTPVTGAVTYDVATQTFNPPAIVVGGGYRYGDTGPFGSCYQHNGGAGTGPAGVQYSYRGGNQTIATKQLCNINAPVDDLPNPIPAGQIFAVPNITCTNGVASPATFTGTVGIKVAGYYQPAYDPHYGGGVGSITLTANVKCPPAPCSPGQIPYTYRGGTGCCAAGTTPDGEGNCATPCPTGASWDRYSASCLCAGSGQPPVSNLCCNSGMVVTRNGVCGCPNNLTLQNGTCGCPATTVLVNGYCHVQVQCRAPMIPADNSTVCLCPNGKSPIPPTTTSPGGCPK